MGPGAGVVRRGRCEGGQTERCEGRADRAAFVRLWIEAGSLIPSGTGNKTLLSWLPAPLPPAARGHLQHLLGEGAPAAGIGVCRAVTRP